MLLIVIVRSCFSFHLHGGRAAPHAAPRLRLLLRRGGRHARAGGLRQHGRHAAAAVPRHPRAHRRRQHQHHAVPEQGRIRIQVHNVDCRYADIITNQISL